MVEVRQSNSSDEGDWKCVVTSADGSVGISTCAVEMDIPKNYRKPRFMENLKAVLTEEGLVSFECKVVGFPTPQLKWYKDNQELKPGDVYQLTGTNSLGTYCCVAKNCMGETSSTAILTVEDIQDKLNEEERLLYSQKSNLAPKFVKGLKSQDAKINEDFRFLVEGRRQFRLQCFMKFVRKLTTAYTQTKMSVNAKWIPCSRRSTLKCCKPHAFHFYSFLFMICH